MKTLMASLVVLVLSLSAGASAAEPAAPAPAPAAAAAPTPAPAASAQAEVKPATTDDRLGIEVAPKVGGQVPLSKLGTTWGADLELGYLTPLQLPERQLAVVLDVGYTQPVHTHTVADPRVGGGQYDFTLTQHELNLFLGPKYFILPTTSLVLPFVAVGVKLQLLRSDVVGSAGGAALGANGETSTQVGGALRGGAGYLLGPGHLFGELEVAYAGVDEAVTGKANVADVGLQVGYLLLF